MGTSQVARISRQVSRPEIPGKFTSRRIKSGAHAANFFERFFAAAHFDDGIALRRERGEHDAADLRFIIHNENGGGVHQSLVRPRSVGSVKEKTEPWPRWLVRLMVPPCASMMALAMGRPMPVPCTR